ncbi:MAG: TonB-dependent receptor, partial [Gammaproteobacteria bacterium]|nr:TonB-dependent receptor [Gammaproteobacteria bacterium]
PGFFPADIRDVESSSVFLRWTHTEDSDTAWQLQFNRSAYESDENARLLVSDWYDVAPEVVPFIIGQPDQYFSYNQFETDSLTHDIEIQRASLLGQQLRLTIGAGYRWEAVRHFLTADRKHTANSLRVFGAVEWRPSDNLVVTANALLDDNTLGGTSISPRIGANYRLSNGDTLRTAATRGHKHPSLLEENWDAMMRLDDGTPVTLWAKSDGNLDAEQRTVFEVGYLGQRFDERLQFDARVYHEDVDDAVIYARDITCPQPIGFPFCYRVGNYLAYKAVGAELGLDFRATARDTLRISYAYADIDGSVPYYLVPEIEQDLEHTAPRHSGSLLVSHRFDLGWEVSGAVYAARKTNWYIDGSFVEDALRLDLRLAKAMKFGRSDAKLELIVQNLGGDYEEFMSQNRFDTRAFMRFGIDLP